MRSMTALEFKMYSAWLNGAAPPDLPGDPAVLQAELSNTTNPSPALLFLEPTNFSPDDESRLLALSQLYDLGPNDRVDQFDMNNMLSMDHLRYFEAKFPQLQPLILAHCRVLLQYSMQELNHEVYTERVRAECHALRTQLALLDYRVSEGASDLEPAVMLTPAPRSLAQIQEHVRQNAQTLQIASANGQLLRNRLQQLTHLLEGGAAAAIPTPRAIQQRSTQAQSGDSSNKRKANEATPAEEDTAGESNRSVRPRHEDEEEPHRAVESGHDEPTDDVQDLVNENGRAADGDENNAGGGRASVERETTPNVQEHHEPEARESPAGEHDSAEERNGEQEHAVGDGEVIKEVGQEEIVTDQVNNERDDRSVTPEATGQVQDEHHVVHEDGPFDTSVHEDPPSDGNVPQGPPSPGNSMEAHHSDNQSHNNEAARSPLGDNTHRDSPHDITMNDNSEDGRWNEAAEDVLDKENTHQQTRELHSGPTTPGESAESSMAQAQQHHTEISASATERLTEQALRDFVWKDPSAATTTAATSAADSQQAEAFINAQESMASIDKFSRLFAQPEQPTGRPRSPSPRVTRSSSRLRESSGASGGGGGGGESSATGAQESQSQVQLPSGIAARRAGPLSYLFQSLPHVLTSGTSQAQESQLPPSRLGAGDGQGLESQLPDGR